MMKVIVNIYNWTMSNIYYVARAIYQGTRFLRMNCKLENIVNVTVLAVVIPVITSL